MRNKLALLALVLFSTVACEEKDISEDNPAPAEENVILNASFVYGNMGLRRDTMYTNDRGDQFFIEDVRLLFSDFIFYDNSDTILHDSTVFQMTMDDYEEPLVRLEPGGYSLRYGMTLGIDSLRSVMVNAAMLEEQDEDIDASNYLRSGGFGVSHLVIVGRLLDPSNPEDSTGTIPMRYEIGTFFTNQDYNSEPINFSVGTNRNMPLIAVINIKPILHDFNISGRPIVTTELGNQIDLSLAIQMSDSLQVGLF